MLSPSEDFKDMLESESSLELTLASNLFINRLLDQPANCVTLFDRSGFPPAVVLNGNAGFYYPSVQIIVRNTSQSAAYDLACRIMLFLHGRGPEVWNETTYASIICVGDPSFLGWDEKNRCSYTLNFNILRHS